MTKKAIDLSYFHNHLRNGLDFCKKVHNLFYQISKTPDGVQKLRARGAKGRRLEKKLIEELLPIAGYIQAKYNAGRQIRVRWVDSSVDAWLLSRGFLAEKGLVPKRQAIEVTTAVHKDDHINRRLLNEKGFTFGVKGIQKDPQTGKFMSRPWPYDDGEWRQNLANKILERIKVKNAGDYPPDTVLIIQCFLETLFWENEWEDAIKIVRENVIEHKFWEIFLLDSNRFSATLPGTR